MPFRFFIFALVCACAGSATGCAPRLAAALFRTGAEVAYTAAVVSAATESSDEQAAAEETYDGPTRYVVVAPKPRVEAVAFDSRAARVALEQVSGSECGTGGEVRLEIIFRKDGRAIDVDLGDVELDAPVRACLVERFAKVRVPSFDTATTHAVAWTIHLPTQASAQATLPDPWTTE